MPRRASPGLWEGSPRTLQGPLRQFPSGDRGGDRTLERRLVPVRTCSTWTWAVRGQVLRPPSCCLSAPAACQAEGGAGRCPWVIVGPARPRDLTVEEQGRQNLWASPGGTRPELQRKEGWTLGPLHGPRGILPGQTDSSEDRMLPLVICGKGAQVLIGAAWPGGPMPRAAEGAWPSHQGTYYPRIFASLQGGLGRAQGDSPCLPREGALDPCRSQGLLHGAHGRWASAGLWGLQCVEDGVPQ